MITQVIKLIKKIIISFFTLYGYNIITPSIAIVPLNIITLTITTLFNLPGLITLVIIKVLIY